MKVLIPVLLLAVASCGPILGKEDQKIEALDQATVDAVVEDLLTSITHKHEEIGPLVTSHLHDLKNEAAELEGFDGWLAFKLSLRATDPNLEVEVANRITAHMNSLVESE